LDTENNRVVIKNDSRGKGRWKTHRGDLAFYKEGGVFVTNLEFILKGAECIIDLSVHEDLHYVEILPNYSNSGYFYYELSESQRKFFTDLDFIKQFDVNTLTVFHQYMYLSSVWGKSTIKEYLKTVTRIITAHPYTVNI